MNKILDIERVLGRIFIVIAASVLTLFIIDRLSIRFMEHRQSPIEREFPVRDVRQPGPYVMFGGKPGGKSWPVRMKDGTIKEVILNDLGYRDDAPNLPKDPGEFRVIVIGGSAVFMGNPPIPRLIQYQFEQKGCDKVKVYNFGVVSSMSGMELARILFEAVDYQPDLIISYSGFNDIDQPWVADPRPGYPYNFFIYESNPLLESDIRTYPALPLLAYGSNLMRYFFPHYFISKFVSMGQLRQKAGYRTAAWEEAISSIYVRNLVKTRKVARAFGADFIAFFQPSLYFKRNASQAETRLIDSQRKESAMRMRRIILEKIEVSQETENLLFFDLSNMFKDSPETVYKDRVHTLSEYYPAVAKVIYRHLLSYLQQHIEIPLGPSCR